jgi:hypothetical protein
MLMTPPPSIASCTAASTRCEADSRSFIRDSLRPVAANCGFSIAIMSRARPAVLFAGQLSARLSQASGGPLPDVMSMRQGQSDAACWATMASSARWLTCCGLL